MGLAENMKRMGEDIVSSYDMRFKAVGMLVNDVQKTLKSFAAARKKMAGEQAKDLDDFVLNLSKYVTDLLRSADDFLKKIQRNHKEMSKEQAKELGDFVADLNRDVGNMIKDFQKDHKAMSDSLKANLENSKKNLEAYVKTKLKEFTAGRADMSAKLKRDLAKYVSGIVVDTRKLLNGFRDERKKLEDELRKMAAHWQAVSSTLAKKRGAKPKIEAEIKVRTVKEAIEEIKPAKKRVTKETPDIEMKLVDLINQHPEGILLSEAARSLGVIPIVLGRSIKKLVDQGKIRKEDNLYFPVHG